ncbi:ATP-grasp domain-containing protein [Pseudalkalibacillus sp. Hm43]|uniref:ATP-grasp domain-containing protein n=1 Tax=Pseudalkalibacillus sp. Hm43 TaxID=3450742 RepID=UPI003F44424C
MQTIVFIGTNKSGSSREAIRAAEKMGYFTILLTNQKKFIKQRTEFEDIHEIIYSRFTKKELRFHLKEQTQKGREIKSIVSFIDPYVHLAAELADEYGVCNVSVEALGKMENKYETHRVLAGMGLTPYAKFYYPGDSIFEFINTLDLTRNWIVKSPTSTGSKDVILTKGMEEIQHAIQRLSERYPEEVILVEEYLEGPQYLVEILIDGGIIHTIAVIKQKIQIGKRFIITGYAVLPALVEEELKNSLDETISKIIAAFKLRSGACHLELRLVQGEWRLIEINPRISGGAMNDMIEAATGINLVAETLKLNLGDNPNINKRRSRPVYTHYLTIDKKGTLLKVTGKKRASRCPEVEKVYIKPRKGMFLRPPLSMGNRYGYIIATGKTIEEAKQNALNASKEIRFHLEPL